MHQMNNITDISNLFCRETRAYLEPGQAISLASSQPYEEKIKDLPNHAKNYDNSLYKAKIQCLNLIIFAEHNPKSVLLKIYFGDDLELPLNGPMCSVEEKAALDEGHQWCRMVAIVGSKAEALALLELFVENFGFTFETQVDTNGNSFFYIKPQIH